MPAPDKPLAFTGERMTSAAEGQIEFEHYHRYCFTRDLCDGRDVLDVASGEGYGAAMLAGVARSVIGVEIDSDSVAHATANYAGATLRFLRGDALALPLADASVDIVVSFETLEHLDDQQRFIAEVRRVLRPGGLFVVSTPDRSVYSAPGSDPNPHHKLELTEPEFRSLLRAHFVNQALLAQRPVLGSLLAGNGGAGWRSYERRGPDIIEATNGLARAHYLVALASDGRLPDIGSSVYFDRRRVHDVVQDAARLPALDARAEEFVRERNEARAEAAHYRTAHEALAAKSRLDGNAQAQLNAFRADATLSRRLRAQLQVAEAEAAAGAERVAGLEAALRESCDTAGRLTLEAARLGRELDAVVYSTSWRLLAPARAAGRRLPGQARKLRWLAKLVWWTLTLQIGHRAVWWRQHRRGAAAVSSQPAAMLEAEAEVAVPAAPEQRAPDLRDAFQALLAAAAIDFPAVAAPDVSIIVPVYGGRADVETCLRSLAAARQGGPSFEVILVDDCPAAPVHFAIPNSSGLRKIVNSENVGFLLSCNRGAREARGRVLCFLNSDTIVMPNWLGSLVAALEETPGAAIAGGMLLNANNTIQSAGWCILGNGWGQPIGAGADPRDGAYTYRRRVDCVTGACFVVTKALFDDLGGLDEQYAPAFYEEFDFAFRARARGLHVVYEPSSRVIHLGSASYGAERRDQLSGINHAKFVARFADALARQPDGTGDAFMLCHGTAAGPVLFVVDQGIPRVDRHAGDLTMSQYMSLLAAAGWRIVFAPMNGVADGQAAAALERQGIELIRRPWTIKGWLERNGRHVSNVWLARPEIAEALIATIRGTTQAQIAYYPHDLHHVRLEMGARLLGDANLARQAAQVREQECAVLRAVDHIMPPSAEEAALISDLAPGTKVTVLPPYYYDEQDFLPRDAAHFRALTDIVFVGGFPHLPNVDAALFIANEIMPLVWQDLPQARLVLVGYAPPPEVLALAGPRVLVTGQVPTVAPFLEQARLVLCALRYGAGVKNKVVDAMRMGVPVVTTAIGGEGIGIETGLHAIVADAPDALAAAVIELFASPERCAALSAAGASLVRQRFSRTAARVALRQVFRTPRCAVCGSGSVVAGPREGNFREAQACNNCWATSRAEALARLAVARLGRHGEESLAELARGRAAWRVHEFGCSGAIADTLRWQQWYSMSEFFDEVVPGGAGPGGLRCEDLSRLTYADASFDVVISQDVLEHVPDPAAAFAETARVLRPGGAHIFTVPQDLSHAESFARARLGPGGIEYLYPPDYHGDPVRPEGALVFSEFGRDLAEIVQRAGLTLIEHDLPVLGGADDQMVRVFEAVKPGAR